ncbi:MAG: tetratricopeptide repeat protein [Candidatus Cloacimonetes bacterium]|nr:tetratricopeptide repeat protein [Candidatus Cloacimonadota bacterium]
MFKKLLLVSCLLSIPATNFVEADGYKSQGEWGDQVTMKRKKGRKKKGRPQKQFKKEIESWVKTLPEDQAVQAQKVFHYLMTSAGVAKGYERDKNHQKSIEVLTKRAKLKLPAFFSSAPAVLGLHKAQSYHMIARSYLKQDKTSEAISYLEKALAEVKTKDAKMLKSMISRDLMKAYKKNGQSEKAFQMMEQSLNEASSGLNFE